MESFLRSTAAGHESMKLRAHHLLCIFGFQGLGYSQEFVDNMTKIVEQLHPSALIQVFSKPDDICTFCPFLGEKGCQKKGPESESVVRNQDLTVMEKLNIVAGDKITWAEVKERVCHLIAPGGLMDICGDCPWLPQGYCTEGLVKARQEIGGGKICR